MKNYRNFLTILLVIVVIALIALICYIGYDIYAQAKLDEEAKSAVSDIENDINQNNIDIGDIGNIGTNNENNTNQNISNPLDSLNNTNNGQINSDKKYTYKGFNVVGIISIPKLNIEFPILDKMSIESLKVSVVCIYPVPAELNKVGNNVIVGHNYRNNSFFSKIYTLKKDDEIYITDLINNQKVRYLVYNVYETTDSDSSYIVRNTNGEREISLSTCTANDSKKRTVVWAKEG